MGCIMYKYISTKYFKFYDVQVVQAAKPLYVVQCTKVQLML